MNSKKFGADMKEFSEFFLIAQPVIAQIEANPQEDVLLFLQKKLMHVSPNVLKMMESKLLCPLLAILMKENVANGIKEKTIECISKIIMITKIAKVEVFFRLYSLICHQIFDNKTFGLKTNIPEELIKAVMTCLKSLINSMANDDIHCVYEEPMTKVISQGILLAAQIVKREKSVEVRCSALDFILAMSQYLSNNSEVIEKVGVMFMNFLPGLVTPLTEIICKENTTHHQVILLSIRCWGHILCLALRDVPSEDLPVSDEEVILSWLGSSQNRKADDQTQWLRVLAQPKRTREWTVAAAATLQTVISQVASNSRHPHVSVRCEIIYVFCRLLSECSGSLGSHAGPLLDTLVGLTQDESSEVKEKSAIALYSLETETATLCQLSQDRLPEVVSQLNRFQRVQEQDKVNACLKMLAGYLDLFRGTGACTAPCVVFNPLLLRRLLPLLKIVARLNLTNDLLHQHNLDPADFDQYCLAWNERTYISDKVTLKTLERICYHISAWSMESASSLLIDDYHAGGDGVLESLVVLNMAVRGWVRPKDSLVSSLLQFYLEANSNLNFDSNAHASPRELEIIVLKMTLVMEGISNIAMVVGTDFENYLLQSIYPVVEKLGNRYSVVRAAANSAATTIAVTCNFKNKEALIEGNVDYLTHHIILRLRKTSDVAVLDAVRVVARLCPAKALPQLGHIVDQILTSSTVQFQSPHVSSYLRVFLAFVQCAAESAPLQQAAEAVPEENKTPGRLLVEYIMKKEKERIQVEEEAVDAEEPEEPETDPPVPKLPPHVTISVNIVRRCLHYLPACNDAQKVLCLEVLDKGLRVVSPWENELLPLVHEVWSPLVRRFDSSAKPLIISRSFTLLRNLSSLAKDFIRFRTLKEVLPALRDFLVRSAQVSRNQRSDTAFTTTQGFKLQRELLSGLGSMVSDLRLRERETSYVVEAAIPYLSKLQPISLQTQAVELYTTLLKYDPCLIIYRLQSINNHEEFFQNIQSILKKP